jgi:hypothetical protein
MVVAISYGEDVDWEKISATGAVDRSSKAMDIKTFLKRCKKFSKKMVSIIHAKITPSTGAGPTFSAAPTSSANPSEVP